MQQTYTTTPTEAASGAAATEGAPSLNSGSSGDSGSSGLSQSSKRVIIGVVVGVGGAIVIGAIALVAWRIWGRKRNAQGADDDDDLINAGTAVGSASREKAPSPGAGSTPFRATLDQYHNPGPVNAASNF